MKINYRPLLISLMLLCSLFAMGQKKKAAYTYDWNAYLLDECYGYFIEPRYDIKFKSVTMESYAASDSTMKDIKLDDKTITTYNKNGSMLMSLSLDGEGLAVDSTVSVYNKTGMKVQQTNYEIADSTGKMALKYKEMLMYDAKGNVIKDSTIDINTTTNYDEVTTAGKTYITIEVNYSKYDATGNKIWKMDISSDNGDTVIGIYLYNSKGGLVKDSEYTYRRWNVTEYAYDAAGNVTETLNMGDGYSTKYLSKFDKLNREIEWREYQQDKLMAYRTTQYISGPDSGYIQTEYNYSSNADSLSCSNDSKTVSTYDKHDNRISQVTQREKDGQPFTETVLDNYQYLKSGKILSDTETNASEGNMYWSKSMLVKTYTYDAHENQLSTEERGGGEYSNNSRAEYAYNAYNKMVKDEEYNSCAGKPIKSTITEYYPDGINVKQQTILSSYNTTITSYGKDGRKLEQLLYSNYGTDRTVNKTVWKYTE